MRAIKKTIRIVCWILLSLGLLAGILYLLLGLSPVQQKIKELALQEITKKTQSKISIGNLRFRPFNRLQLEDVVAADLNNDTLLYVKNLNIDLNLFKLLRKQFIIHSVEIADFNVHISRDSLNAPFNFQFLIDAFASDTTQTAGSSNLHLALNRILLTNGRLRYDVSSEPLQAPGLFDVNHIDVRNLQLDAGVHFSSLENWNGSIDHFSLDEKSGFSLKQMSFQIKSVNSRMQVDKFHLSLPHSEGEIEEASLDYTGLELSKILTGATYSIRSISGEWYPADFSFFYPELTQYPDTIRCSGEIKGVFPGISLPHWEMNYGNRLQLAFTAGIADYTAWKTSAFELILEKCSVDPKLFELPLNVDAVSLNGHITGSLPNVSFALSAANKQGDLNVTGTGGYDVSSENVRFDLNMESSKYNLRNLLSDSTLGTASFRLATQGTITGRKKIDAKADAEVNQFDYLGYSYRDITLHAACKNDSVSMNIVSNDAHLPFVFHGKASLNKENAFAHLRLQLNGVCPDVLHLLPQYPGSKLSGSIRADIQGFDPERMNASIAVDHLHWSSPAGDFNDSPITFSYIAENDGQKQVDLQSHTLNVRGKGHFTYDGIVQSFSQAFPGFLPSNSSTNKKKSSERENFDLRVAIHQANTVAPLLGIQSAIPDSALLIGKYTKEGEGLTMNMTAYCIFFQADTVRVNLNLANEQKNLAVRLGVRNKSNQYSLDGTIDASVEFIPDSSGKKPDMNIEIKPGMLTLNGTSFQINPAQVSITNGRYEIRNFALSYSPSEYLKVNGVLSNNTQDSIQVTVNRFEIGTFLSALKNNFPLSGTASGDITLSRMMTNPLILTRNFTIDTMVFDGNPIGNLQIRSAWSSERQGLALRATWTSPSATESVISGFVLPTKDSIALTANVQGIQLKWLDGYFPSYGLTGEMGAQLKAAGKLDAPDLTGVVRLNNVTAYIPTLNAKYRVSDSISIEKDQIIFRDCMIYDENNRSLKINGSIGHKQFSSLNPKLSLDFNRFLVLNNSNQTDSLFYGLIQLNGNLTVALQNKDWLIQGQLSNERGNRIMVNLPESAMEAQRYNWLTFVEKRDSTAAVKDQIASALSAVSLPLKLHITLSVDPGLTLGAIINPDTKDAAVVTGRGLFDFSYSLDNPVPYLLGSYVINDGKCTLSLKNITKKTFSVQPGGKLNFQGDLMNTTFDLTAVYNLRAYLTSLDPGFATLTTPSKIPVNCLLSANGKMDDMRLIYQIELPNQPDEIKRKLDGIIYTDEIKIKQIAYLLAFGSFMPLNSTAGNFGNASFWTSLASSSITSQLNHLLSGVLSDNWSIGTDLHSSDTNFSDVDMDVNISARMFNDRLTVNSTLGYHNNTTQTTNFTGDFNVEYKLTSRGNVLLQFYNVTNNQYYDRSRSPLTQGVGIVYKREGRTFRQLFRSLRLKQRKAEAPPATTP